MSRQGPAPRTVAHSRPLRWDATPSRMGVDGSCEWGWGAFVSFNHGHDVCHAMGEGCSSTSFARARR